MISVLRVELEALEESYLRIRGFARSVDARHVGSVGMKDFIRMAMKETVVRNVVSIDDTVEPPGPKEVREKRK